MVLRTRVPRTLVLLYCFFRAAETLFGGGGIQESSSRIPASSAAVQAAEPAPPESPAPSALEPSAPAASNPEPSAPAASGRPLTEQPVPDRGETVMKALAAAYPGQVGPAEFRNGDWAAPVRGDWFYYAGGRLLPEALRDQATDYDPQPFYNYAPELPPWKEPEPEAASRFRNSAQRRQANPPKRSQHFYDALWRAHTKEESYERVKTIRFLGRNVLVHYAIMEELALVEEQILEDAKNDPQIRQWIGRLDTLAGWNWRDIADTQSRSFHAYGTALDLLPASPGGLETYWLWTARTIPEWWAVPYEKRLHPPQGVIKAFESRGFIWGGKWLFFDTMHFEYRPEILILNGIGIDPSY